MIKLCVNCKFYKRANPCKQCLRNYNKEYYRKASIIDKLIRRITEVFRWH